MYRLSFVAALSLNLFSKQLSASSFHQLTKTRGLAYYTMAERTTRRSARLRKQSQASLSSDATPENTLPLSLLPVKRNRRRNARNSKTGKVDEHLNGTPADPDAQVNSVSEVQEERKLSSAPAQKRQRRASTSSKRKTRNGSTHESQLIVDNASPSADSSRVQTLKPNDTEQAKSILNSADPLTGPVPPLDLYPSGHDQRPWGPSQNSTTLSIVSWNVASMRTVLRTGILQGYIDLEKPDVLCIQETKMTAEAANKTPPISGYTIYWNHSEKKGYSGVATLVKDGVHVKHVETGMGLPEADAEGRVLVIHIGRFAIVNAYVPNSGGKLARLDFRTNSYEPAMRTFLDELAKKGSVLYCGDLNVAHEVIDIHNSKGNQKSAGHTPEERREFGVLLESGKGWTDVYRKMYAESPGYTYYSRRFGERLKRDGKGWRLDYFLTDNKSFEQGFIQDCFVRPAVGGSDHLPLVTYVDVGYWGEKENPENVK